MVPQDVQRYPDETFYFDGYGGPLCINQEVLDVIQYPSVEIHHSPDVRGAIMTTENIGGQQQNQDITHDSTWTVERGERVVSITTGDRPTHPDWNEGGYKFSDGVRAETYDIQETDTLLLMRRQLRPMRTGRVLHPGGEPIPKDGADYQLLGVIDRAGALHVWGPGAETTSWYVDLAIANRHVRTNVDLYLLEREVGGGHLVGMLSGSAAVTGYFRYHAHQHGVDFMPAQDPRERRDEFPEVLTREQLDRYRQGR